jgi:hypothetical protein
MTKTSPDQADLAAATERAMAVKRRYAPELLAKANVVGVGVGFCQTGGESTGQVGLVVMVNRKLPAVLLDPGDVLPREIDGVPVDVQQVGEVRAQMD